MGQDLKLCTVVQILVRLLVWTTTTGLQHQCYGLPFEEGERVTLNYPTLYGRHLSQKFP